MTVTSRLIIAVVLATAAIVAAADTPSPEPPRLAVLDWTLLETLIALDQPPVAAPNLDGYRTWVGDPPLPAGVVDIGLRTQPNLELLSQLAPDRILLPPLFANLTPVLSRIAPVEVVPLYSREGPLWSNLLDYTQEVAALAGVADAADDLIRSVERRLEDIAAALPPLPALLVVQFQDGRHVRVFGSNSLYGTVLQRLGIRNAWLGKTSYWGFSLVSLDALADRSRLAAGPLRMVVIEPLPAGVRPRLRDSGLWRNLPAVAGAGAVHLPPTWSFGALPSARRFAELLLDAADELSAPGGRG